MARKEIEITIEEGRDAGKTFKITEMPATQADKWVTKVIGLVGRNGMSALDISNMSFSELAVSLIKSKSEESEPLFEELLGCCSFIKDGVSVSMKGKMADSVVEDWGTLFRLKNEALKLIFGFFEEGGESTSK